MIKDIPVQSDFDAVGGALLDQSWEVATSLLTLLDDGKLWFADQEEEAYWLAAHIKLSTAMAIAHQGAEFLLKGRIAAVSPLLLIMNAPREWPKPEADGHISFSQFRTVDAQDIVRLHNGCAAAPLDKDFAVAFEALRIRRNSIMHSVNPNIKVDAATLLGEILMIYKSLMPERNWVDARHEALCESAAAKVWSADWVEASVVREFNAVSQVLTPKAMLDYFGFDKKQRVYLCSNCTYSVCAEEGFESYSATLTTKMAGCDEISCFICRRVEKVQRSACTEKNCKGDVISTEWDKCLTCGADSTAPGE
jgi:hypothetical protein